MAGYVTVVTDSTACLPTDMAARWGISVVQQQLHVGDHLDDEARIAPKTLLDAFADGTPLSTSPPDPGAFFWTYQDAIARGASAVVSLHISGKLSKTADMAKFGAADSRVPVHVVDTGTAGMSLGYAVLAAARIANAGGNVDQVIKAAQGRMSPVGRADPRGNPGIPAPGRPDRCGGAPDRQRTVGETAAHRAERRDRAAGRTMGSDRAIRKLVDTAVAKAGNAPVDIAIEHFGADRRIDYILEQAQEAGAEPEPAQRGRGQRDHHGPRGTGRHRAHDLAGRDRTGETASLRFRGTVIRSR